MAKHTPSISHIHTLHAYFTSDPIRVPLYTHAHGWSKRDELAVAASLVSGALPVLSLSLSLSRYKRCNRSSYARNAGAISRPEFATRASASYSYSSFNRLGIFEIFGFFFMERYLSTV